jgi:hypothetical protein
MTSCAMGLTQVPVASSAVDSGSGQKTVTYTYAVTAASVSGAIKYTASFHDSGGNLLPGLSGLTNSQYVIGECESCSRHCFGLSNHVMSASSVHHGCRRQSITAVDIAMTQPLFSMPCLLAHRCHAAYHHLLVVVTACGHLRPWHSPVADTSVFRGGYRR